MCANMQQHNVSAVEGGNSDTQMAPNSWFQQHMRALNKAMALAGSYVMQQNGITQACYMGLEEWGFSGMTWSSACL